MMSFCNVIHIHIMNTRSQQLVIHMTTKNYLCNNLYLATMDVLLEGGIDIKEGRL